MTTTKEKELSTRTWEYKEGDLILTSKVGEEYWLHISSWNRSFQDFLRNEIPIIKWEDDVVYVNDKVVGIYHFDADQLSISIKASKKIRHFFVPSEFPTDLKASLKLAEKTLLAILRENT